MKISVISFTEKGRLLAEQVFTDWSEDEVLRYSRQQEVEHLKEWTMMQFQQKNALVFIGAVGIAVRTIAPFIQDKLTDSPVLCMDEAGQFVIPVLSGHVGGANELAERIAKRLGAIPVITTATDVNQTFAVDVFAQKNHLTIQNKEGIAKISTKVLRHEMVDIVISSELTELSHGILRLKPKEYILGIGCRKGKSYAELAEFIERWLLKLGLTTADILQIASIDLKQQEPGLVQWSNCNRVPFVTYSAAELQEAEGEFVTSQFVEEQTGVDNVCERAAMKAAGAEGTLILRKQAEHGMTLAVAKKKWKLNTEQQEGISIDEA